jgi:hypothetical protein
VVNGEIIVLNGHLVSGRLEEMLTAHGEMSARIQRSS